jgi:peptidylprolyl isomerase
MLTVCSFLLLAQTAFSPKLPDNIPAIDGAATVREPYALRYIDAAEGTGAQAQPGQRYTVHYTGWLRDGKKFDSSRDRKEPFRFVQGKRQVIAGWETGFEGMKVGGRRRLFLPYQLAYGEKGNATIPPRAELIFDVELLGVEDVTETPAGAEVLDPLRELEKKVLALANAVPEDKWDWRPAAGVRSFREAFLHIAYGDRLMTDLAAKFPEKDVLTARVEKQWKDEKESLSKARVI